MNAIEFVDVVKTYKSGLRARHVVAAVRGVTLAIPTGTAFALLGPNRAGKTTLLKMLLSLCRPTGGSIRRLGAPLADRSTLGRIGYMHENHAFPRHLSAAELLYFYGGLSGVPSEQLGGRVDSLLKQVGLGDRRSDPISQFSKGMVQRLGLAQALVNEPELLILDEPTEGLDLLGRLLLRRLVGQFKTAGRTVLLVSHVLTEVEDLCDRVAVLSEGKLVHAGTLAALLRDPASGERRTLETALKPMYEQGGAA